MAQAPLKQLEQIFNDPAAAAVARKLLAAVPGEATSQATDEDAFLDNRLANIVARAGVSKEELAGVKDQSLNPGKILNSLVREGHLQGALYYGKPIYLRPHQ